MRSHSTLPRCHAALLPRCLRYSLLPPITTRKSISQSHEPRSSDNHSPPYCGTARERDKLLLIFFPPSFPSQLSNIRAVGSNDRLNLTYLRRFAVALRPYLDGPVAVIWPLVTLLLRYPITLHLRGAVTKNPTLAYWRSTHAHTPIYTYTPVSPTICCPTFESIDEARRTLPRQSPIIPALSIMQNINRAFRTSRPVQISSPGSPMPPTPRPFIHPVPGRMPSLHRTENPQNSP